MAVIGSVTDVLLPTTWQNPNGLGIRTYPDGTVEKGMFENGKFLYAQKVTPTVTAKKSPEPSSDTQKKLEELQKEIARLKKEKIYFMFSCHWLQRNIHCN